MTDLANGKAMIKGFLRRVQLEARRWNPFHSVGLILMYHRVSDLPSDPQLLCVTPQHLDEQLQVLRAYARPLPLKELADSLRERKLPRRAVSITFDDGYADNLYNAKPLLERHEIPATVFVTTGHTGQEREFWWDELERLLLQPGKLPSTLELRLNGSTWRWELGDAATCTDADYERHRGWHIEQQDDPTSRQQLYRSLYQLLHSLLEGDRQRLLEELRGWAGVETIGRPTHRTLSEDEVVQLAKGKLVEIGAHTLTHPPLATLPLDVQLYEIRCSKNYLETRLDRPVNSFAYPHGSYMRETLALVQEAGFTCACSSDTAVVRRDTDWFRLPRVALRNWDGETFDRWFREWFRE